MYLFGIAICLYRRKSKQRIAVYIITHYCDTFFFILHSANTPYIKTIQTNTKTNKNLISEKIKAKKKLL